MIVDRTEDKLRVVEKMLSNISWIVTLFVMFMIVVDILLRYCFNRPLPASWEFSEICMPLIVFLPFAYTLTLGGHVRVSLLSERVPAKIQVAFELLTNSFSFILCALITYVSFLRFWHSFTLGEEIMAAIKIPWWPGKLAMPVGMGVFSLRYLMRLCGGLNSNK